MAQKRYSRLARVEERKNIRTIVVYGFLSIALVILLLVFGLPGIVKLASFLTNINQTNQPISINDKTPPGPPQINLLPDYTSESRIEVGGTSEAGATVTIFIDSSEKETVAGDDGSFSVSVSLDLGENTIYALATDPAGNKSVESKRYVVNYDNKEPTLDVSSPTDGQSFSGSDNQRIEIKGTTESGVSVTVNDRVAIVDQDGNFTASFNLSEGDNNLEITAKDPAGNETKLNLSVHYSP